MTVDSVEKGREHRIDRDITTASMKRETGNLFMEPKCDGFLKRAVSLRPIKDYP
jgi:hypothetical protein